MRRFLFAFFIISCFVVSAQERMIVSDNKRLNAIIQGFTGYPTSPSGEYISIQIEKARAVNGVYRNVIRLWYGKGNDDYINLFYKTYPTEDSAREDLKTVMRYGSGAVHVNWEEVEGSGMNMDLSDVTFRHIIEGTNHVLGSTRLSLRSFPQPPKEMIEINMSFEGLRLSSQGRLNGIDETTGLNASYYSEDKRIISLRGTPGKAWVELVRAPRRKGTAVLFKAVAANERGIAGDKIRITGGVSGLKAVEIINSVDIFIPRNWRSLVKQEAGISWLTIQEYWCAESGIPIEGEPQFRMTLGILKRTGRGNNLYFDLKAQDLETTQQTDGSWKEKYTTLYELDDRNSKSFKIPLGQWFNLRTEIVAGDKSSGHFRLIATDRKGREHVIFDEICQTFATGYLSPGASQPFYRSVSPLKLYTSTNTLQLMRGKPLCIYYDNWDYQAVCIKEE